MTVRCGSAGEQRYHQWPRGSDLHDRARLTLDGKPLSIRIRAAGSYVVAPGCEADGVAYAVVDRTVAIAEAPRWLVDLLDGVAPDPAAAPAPSSTDSPAGGHGGKSPGVGWPAPLGDAAMHGLAGDFVRTVLPHTEADPAALLVQFLGAFGAWVGRGPGLRIGESTHHARLFLALAGRTSTGRKGTSWDEVKRLFRLVDQEWHDARIASGLSSGEGFIHAVRDPVVERSAMKDRNGKILGYQDEITDHGVDDKRLMVVEPEFARQLGAMKREGNTLSALLRQAWDGQKLATMTKKPYSATGAHVGITVHITGDELLTRFDSTEAANGFGNRFLWLCVKRSKLLPLGGNLTDDDLAGLAHRLQVVGEAARRESTIRRTASADALWVSVYEALTRDRPGLVGALTNRAAPQVLRLSLIYALLDGVAQIDAIHIRAALEVWRFCEASVRYIFGDALGDATADRILADLRLAGDVGRTRTEIRDLFQRNTSEKEIDRALALLAREGMARSVRLPTRGRAAEQWFACTT